MDNINDILQNRAEDLSLERGGQLAAIQEVLNKQYPGKVRAKSLNNGELTITTPSSAVASDLHLSQSNLLQQLKSYQVETIRVKIG
ncbi:MAG: DciA family protein [Candidatus Saccharimonadales bacterium]